MNSTMRVSLLLVLMAGIAGAAKALELADLPADAPNDSIMATGPEISAIAAWTGRVFAVEDAAENAAATGGKRDAAESSLLDDGAPFSFVYGGRPSAELLKSWKHSSKTQSLPDRICHEVSWTDPATSLTVTASVVVYQRYPAVDWVLIFNNAGAHDTPLVENIQPLDVRLLTLPAEKPAVLHRLAGDDCSPQSFSTVDEPLPAGGCPAALFRFSTCSISSADSSRPSAGQDSGRPRTFATPPAKRATAPAWSGRIWYSMRASRSAARACS
jgi:hypothetical protein